MPNYQLVNPYIEGDFKSVFSAKTPYDAAQKAWNSLSQHLTNNVPKFGMSLQTMKGNKLHHFVVKESIRDGLVDYKLIEHDVKLSEVERQRLQEKVDGFRKQSGGRRSRRSKSDDSDSSDLDLSDSTDVYSKVMYNKYLHQSQPILYFWYNPLVYRFDNLFIPTFTIPLTPYIDIDLSSAFVDFLG